MPVFEVMVTAHSESVKRIVKSLQELLHEERNNPGSMAHGHGHALSEAIKLYEEVTRKLLRAETRGRSHQAAPPPAA